MDYWKNLSLEDIEGEEWRDIPGYDGIYQASNYGRIKSLKREYRRKTKYGVVIGFTKECIRKQTAEKNKKCNIEVLRVTLAIDGVRKTDTVNQWVGITFIGEKKKGHHFQHKNKNGLDNRVDNIEQVTITESKSNDFKHNKRRPHNYKHLPKQKLKLVREDGKEFNYTGIVNEYGRAAYFNILKGYNVRGHKWNVVNL